MMMNNEQMEIVDPRIIFPQGRSRPHPFCKVCGDNSTGKHYGCWTCFGCRGFFQRTVRNGTPYVCQFEKNCDINRKQRNKCKYCRFQKCLQEGMRKEAVQDERDRNYKMQQQLQVSIRTGIHESTTVSFLLMLEKSVNAEVLPKFGYQSSSAPPSPSSGSESLKMVTSMQDSYNSYKTDLHVYTEWAKRLPFFRDLEVTDQLALLRGHGAEITTFESIRRSIGFDDGMTVSAQGFCQKVDDDGPLKAFADYGRRVQIILHQPFNALSPSDSEFILLKTLMLLDPAAEGLSEFGRQKVGPLRYQMQLLLEGLTLDKEPGRLSTMLLLLATLFHVAADSRKLTEIVKRSGVVRMPKLVEEVVLSE